MDLLTGLLTTAFLAGGVLALACHVGPLGGGAIRITRACVVDGCRRAVVVRNRGSCRRFRFAEALGKVSRHADD